MKNQDKYKEIKTLNRPNMTVRIHIPDITTEERKRRIELIKKATVNILREVIV